MSVIWSNTKLNCRVQRPSLYLYRNKISHPCGCKTDVQTLPPCPKSYTDEEIRNAYVSARKMSEILRYRCKNGCKSCKFVVFYASKLNKCGVIWDAAMGEFFFFFCYGDLVVSMGGFVVVGSVCIIYGNLVVVGLAHK